MSSTTNILTIPNCGRCGNEMERAITYTGFVWICPYCDASERPMKSVKATRRGWQCPKCGRVWSPIIIECPTCNGPKFIEIVAEDNWEAEAR